jgi:hypothetical protein
MPIVQATIASQIDALIEETSELEPEDAVTAFKDGLADIIKEAIESATVTCTIPAGVVSTGTSPAVVPLPAPLSISGSLS